MIDWIRRLFARPTHEIGAEVQAEQAQQRREFDVWESAKREVRRVERLAADAHTDMHRPRRRRGHRA